MNEESDNESIVELEVPQRSPPLLIDVESEGAEMVLNVTRSIICAQVSDQVATLSTPKTVPVSSKDDHVSPYHWTSDMKDFYNEVWGNEDDFEIETIQNSMKKTRKLWDVGNFRGRLSRKRTACWNCGNYGHSERDCRPACCYMCGGQDHTVKFCPLKKCLTCGSKNKKEYTDTCYSCQKARSSVCLRCNVVGHTLTSCTDHWRRFHHVTTFQCVQPPQQQVHKPNRDLWCCNCGRRGHVEIHCSVAHHGSGAPTTTLVVSYARSFAVDKADKHNSEPILIDDTSAVKMILESPSVSKRNALQNSGPLGTPKCKKRRYFENISGKKPNSLMPSKNIQLSGSPSVISPSQDIAVICEKINKKTEGRIRMNNEICILSQIFQSTSRGKKSRRGRNKRKTKKGAELLMNVIQGNKPSERGQNKLENSGGNKVPNYEQNNIPNDRVNVIETGGLSNDSNNQRNNVPHNVQNSGSLNVLKNVQNGDPSNVQDNPKKIVSNEKANSAQNRTTNIARNIESCNKQKGGPNYVGNGDNNIRNMRALAQKPFQRPNVTPPRKGNRSWFYSHERRPNRNDIPFPRGHLPNSHFYRDNYGQFFPPVQQHMNPHELRGRYRSPMGNFVPPTRGLPYNPPIAQRRRYFDQPLSGPQNTSGNPIGQWNNFLLGFNR